MKRFQPRKSASSPWARLIVATAVVAAVTGGLGAAFGPATPASATSECNVGSGNLYQYSGWYASNFANRGIEGDIDFDDISVEYPALQHALLYLSTFSTSDPNAGYGNDWVQGGYGIGSVDQTSTSDTDVYEESSDYSTDGGQGPVAHFGDYDLGNHYFQAFYQGQTDGQGRGLYDMWYGLGANRVFIGSAWEVNPTGNQLYGQFEGEIDAGVDATCPLLNWGLLGSTGDINNPTSTASTQLNIRDNDPAWVQWAYGTITTTVNLQGHYSLTTYEQFYLFEPAGS